MARPRLSPEQIQQFRDELCKVALRLFAQNGYEAVTLRAISNELGCSHTTPYRYFRSKEEIFTEVRVRAYQHFHKSLQTASKDATLPEDRLWSIGKNYFRYAEQYPQHYRVMFEMTQPPSEHYPQILEAAQAPWSFLLQTVEEAVHTGKIQGDPSTLAHLIWASLHGICSLHLSGKIAWGKNAQDLVEPMLLSIFHSPPPETP